MQNASLSARSGRRATTRLRGSVRSFLRFGALGAVAAALLVAPGTALAATSTTTTITASANPVLARDSVTYTVRVTAPTGSPVPTGPVAVYDGAMRLGTCTLSSGACTYTATGFGVGSHGIVAQYLGDAANATSASSALIQRVNPGYRTVGTGNTTATNGATSITIMKPAAAAAGDILVVGMATTGGTGVTITPPAGWARIGTDVTSTTLLKYGLFYKALTSSDSATSGWIWGLSAAVKASATMMVVSGGDPTVAPQAATRVNASSTTIATPALTLSGTTTGVAMILGGTAIGTTIPSVSTGWTRAGAVSASGGKANTQTTAGAGYAAATTTSSIAAGSLTAGAAAVNVGATVFVRQAKGSTALVVTTSAASVTYGTALRLTVRIDGTTATGPVTIYDGSTALNACTLGGGTCSITVNTLAVGVHSLSASYAGDANWLASSSYFTSQTIVASPTTTRLSSSANPANYGDIISITATVSTGDTTFATGNVSFTDNGVYLGSCALGGVTPGACSIISNGLSVGSHVINASYGGDAGHTGSVAASMTQLISQAVSTTSVLSNLNPATIGDTRVAYSVTVTAPNGTPTGAVNVTDNGVLIGACQLSGGSCDVPSGYLTLGDHPIVATYTGDATRRGSTSATYTQTVLKAPVAVALSSATNPSTLGTSVVFTATVTTYDGVAATGTITISDGGTAIGTCALGTTVAGACTYATSGLSVGSHTIVASFAGDASHRADVSAALTQVVDRASSTTTVTANPTAITYPSSVTFTATVASGAGTPTGTVTFSDGTTGLGVCTLGTVTAGACSISAPGLIGGTHQIVARYSGDANRAPSTSSTLAFVVNRLATTTTLQSGANPAIYGMTITYTVVVSQAAATGSISLSEGTATLGSCVLASGRCTITVAGLTGGNHSLIARYSGDPNYGSSNSATLTQQVSTASTSTTVAANPTSAIYGTPITLTGLVSPSTLTGAIAFSDGTTPLGSCLPSGGTCSITIATFAVGTRSVTARYVGDTNYGTSTSTAAQIAISATPTSTALTSSANPAGFGRTVRLTAAVSPSISVGTVRFLEGGTELGTCTLSDGTCFLETGTLSVGTHALVARYDGNANTLGSTSSFLYQEVKVGSSVDLVSTTALTTYGDPIGFIATVTTDDGVVATGTVALMDGETILDTCSLQALDPNSCSITTTAVAAGSRTITARYLGDTTHAPSTSAGVAQSVLRAASTTTLFGGGSSTYGDPVTVSIVVTTVDGSLATGSVSLSDGSTTIAGCQLSNGACDITTSVLTGGAHTLTATFAGDPNHLGSVSGSVSQTVSKQATTTTVAATPTSGVFGTPVTLTTTVTSSSATGTVTFLDGATTLTTCTLAAGTCSATVTSLGAATHSITARYNGDTNYATSTSAATSVTITRGTSTIALAASATSTTYGTSIAFTATVTPSAATGSVSFRDGGTTIGSCTLASGTCTASIATLAVGDHSISAVYAGGTDLVGSTSSAVAVSVSQAVTSLRITSSANPAMIGSGTLTVTASPATATGSVTISLDSVDTFTCTFVSGSCSVSLAGLTIGSYTMVATYPGDANHLAAVSAPFTQQIAMGVRAAASAASGTKATTSLGVTVPAAVRSGDVLVATIGIASSTLTISGPAGWTRLTADTPSATGGFLQSVWWKAASSGDAGKAATWTFSGNVRGAVVMYAVAGASTALPGAEQVRSSANPFSLSTINMPTLNLGTTRTGMALTFGGIQAGVSQTGVGTGYTMPASGGSAAATGGSGTTQAAMGSGYSGLLTDATVYPTTVTMSGVGMNIGTMVFLDQLQ